MPEFLEYAFVGQGFIPFFIKTKKDRIDHFTVVDASGAGASERASFTCGVSDYRWAMKEIPQIKEESYTSSINNFKSKIEFQLSALKDPLSPRSLMNSWTTVTKDLLADDDFGKNLSTANFWLADVVKPLLVGATTNLEKAQRIYAYLRDNITCTSHYGIYTSQPLKNILKNKNGRVSEINLLLTAMLRYAGIDADPVILSTRENGYTFSVYPLISSYNYLVSRITIDGQNYMLDASHPRLGFGKMPYNCYNGNARVINKSADLLALPAENLKEKKLTAVRLVNDKDGKWSGSTQQTMGYYESYEARQKVVEKGKEAFFKDIEKTYGLDAQLKAQVIDSLTKLEEPVGLAYNFDLNIDKEDILYISPMFGEGYKENPFKSAERVYPVEMPYTFEETYVATIETPVGYELEEMPKSTKIKLNEEGEGYFEYLLSKSEGTISMRTIVKLQRATFQPEEYEMLREFFNLIVSKQKEQLVFKKKNNRMHRLALFFALAFSSVVFAADAPYAVSAIPATLLKDANVVKRVENYRFEVVSATQTVLTYKYAFTILNENGDEHTSLVEWYDKLRKIESIEGSLYDATGKVIKTVKAKDIQDLSGVSDISLIDDTRKKVHNFYHKVYPFTIEYEVQIRYNNTFHFPSWITQEDEHIAVQKSSYSFICPANYQFRYRATNYKGEPAQGAEKGKKWFTWQVENLPALKKEVSAPGWLSLTTTLSLAPTLFEVEGYKGDMTTWKEFGKFLYALKKEKDVLPEAIKQKVKNLVSGATTDKEKIKLLYAFLQQNTRYISIQLGIGGWQPFDAAYVASKGYGDCKALTNYMYSLLKEANITSYYALIKAGRGEHNLVEDFPSNQFNHAVLCVPLAKDTVWLECTSQTDAAGYMGAFTGNRKALLVDETGGVLVRTPKYGLAENLQVRTIKGTVADNGSLSMKVDTRYHSIQQDGLHQMINGLSKDKVKELLQQELDLATYNVNDFKYTGQNEAFPQIHETLDIDVSNYATATGKRLFLTPNLLNRSSSPSTETDRKYDVCFEYAYKDVDSIEIEVPEGYEVEALPPPVSLLTPFGSYQSSVQVNQNKVTYLRVREQFTGTFPSSNYAALLKYNTAIFKADRSRLVLVKKE